MLSPRIFRVRLKRLEIRGAKGFPKGLNLQIYNGLLALIGPNGSGKTTALELANLALDLVSRGKFDPKHGDRKDEWLAFDQAVFYFETDQIPVPIADLGAGLQNSEANTVIVTMESVEDRSVFTRIQVGDVVIEVIDKENRFEPSSKIDALNRQLNNVMNVPRQPGISPEQKRNALADISAKEKEIDQESRGLIPFLKDGQPVKIATQLVEEFLRTIRFPRPKYIAANRVEQTDLQPLLDRMCAAKKGNRADAKEHDKSVERLERLIDAEITFIERGSDNKTTRYLHIDGKDHTLASNGTKACLHFFAAVDDLKSGDTIVLWDEPENGLHASRRHYLKALMQRMHSQFIVGTHATELTPIHDSTIDIYQLNVDRSDPPEFDCTKVTSRGEAFKLLDSLGVQPSATLFTANVVIWVEGPTELIFWQWALQYKAPRFVMGYHYCFMLYGGSLLGTVSVDDEISTEKFDLISLCRHPVVVVDSDAPDENTWGNIPKKFPKKYAKTLHDNTESTNTKRPGAALFVYTNGREIENYLPTNAVRHAVSELACLDDDEKNKLEQDLKIGLFDQYEIKIGEAMVANSIVRKNNKGENVAKGKSKWGDKPKFMAEALKTPGLNFDSLTDKSKADVMRVVEFLEKKTKHL